MLKIFNIIIMSKSEWRFKLSSVYDAGFMERESEEREYLILKQVKEILDEGGA